MTGFVHLRAHSSYSLSEGAIKADKLPALARAEKMPAVALTDTNNLFGSLEFSQACVGAGVQPIVGCQISVARASTGLPVPPDPVVLLAQDAEGLANLQKLSSAAFLEAGPGLVPQLPFERVAEHAGGLFLLTGGSNGPLGKMLADGQRAGAEALLARMHAAFGDRCAVELHRHGTALDAAVGPGLIALADARNMPVVATNDVYFANVGMHEAHDALLCIAEGRTMSERDRRRVTAEHAFKSAAAMRVAFADITDACDNTLAIARSCAVMVEPRKPLLPISPKVRPGETEASTLRALAEAGLRARAPENAALYEERLAYELGVIEAMGFPGYFLIVADFIQWAKQQGIPVGPGRGSGAGSVAAWALTITDLDPLRWGLLFERFLNPERVSMPDFDIDFCQERRDEVIAYVRREYGADRVAQIITFGKLQARAAVRDVGRVLGLPFGQVNRVAELIPNNPAKPVTLQQAVDGEKRLQEMRDTDESVRRLLEIALQLEGLYRHASTHAAGVVIGDRPLSELVPLYRDPKSDFLVTQYSMKYVEQAGLVKFDFLGLTTLTILQRATQFLAALGETVDLERLPLDDARTYAMLARGEVGGVFQFEGQGMRDMLRQMRPDVFEDLIAGVAMYRPGPMANIPEFCRRKHEGTEDAPHPSIEGILAPTYGIIVYQEQVMQIAQVMGGYSLGAADLLRRAMGKKIRSEMEAQRGIFVAGAIARGVAAAKAAEVFDLMAKFADYGFNKSHAAAYALVAYQTAWMRANHPAVFLAACMSLAIGNTDKLAALKQEAERAGIKLLPPDINASGADFSVERAADGTLAIRYALAAIKKAGLAAMQALVAKRGDRAFASVVDFAGRTDGTAINKLALENLARAGAFDTLDRNRARIVAGADTILRRAQADSEDRASGQHGLFAANPEPAPLKLPDIPDWPELDRLSQEADAVGFHLTAHPLDTYRATLAKLGVVSARDIDARAASSPRIRVAGIVIAEKQRMTRTGSRMAWLRVSDATGSYEVTVFSEVLSRHRDDLAVGSAVMIAADVQRDGETVRLTVASVTPLDQAAAEAGQGLKIWIDGSAAVGHVRALLDRQGVGRGKVVLIPRAERLDGIELALPGGWNVTPRLAQALRTQPGVVRTEDF